MLPAVTNGSFSECLLYSIFYVRLSSSKKGFHGKVLAGKNQEVFKLSPGTVICMSSNLIRPRIRI